MTHYRQSFLFSVQLGCLALLFPHHLCLLQNSVMFGQLGLFLQSQFLLFFLHDVVHQNALVFESVTLDHHVQLVVLMLVNLSRLSVFSDEFSQNSDSLDPQNLAGHSCIGSTLSLTGSRVSALSLGQHSLSHSPPEERKGTLKIKIIFENKISTRCKRSRILFHHLPGTKNCHIINEACFTEA